MTGVFRGPGFRIFKALSFAFFLVSCASRPGTRAPELPAATTVFSVLPGGASLYIYADVERARPVLELMEFGGMSGASAAVILDRTSTAVAAFYGGEEGRGYMLWGGGRYPSLRSSLSFTFSRAWRKQKSETGNSYWRNRDEGLSVLIKSGYALVSDGDPFFTGPALEPAALWTRLEGGALLSGAAEKAGDRVNAFLNGLGLPLRFPAETLVFGLYPAEAALGSSAPGGEPLYRCLFYIETPSISQARSVQSLLSLAKRIFDNEAETGDDPFMAVMSALFANPVRLDGTTISINTGAMSAGEVALLFNSFSAGTLSNTEFYP
ncbi:MAG: hypothetical protein LBK64_04890 [Spirochaetaceae bacterium]|jgi:hypothetical protein|nr:hypothetical protein [Spirochaetaceae bacterium]